MIIRVSSRNPEKEIIQKAAKIIKKGGLVVFPTDTVYGLLADATNEEAVKKVFKIKKRQKTKPLSIFIKGIKEVRKIAFVGKQQEKFLEENTSGKITVILERKSNCGLPEILFGEEETIGVRIIDYKLVNELLSKTKKPLTATSANVSGKPASTRIKEVLEQFLGEKIQPDLIIDAGDLPENRPSKVIDLTNKKIKIIRF